MPFTGALEAQQVARRECCETRLDFEVDCYGHGEETRANFCHAGFLVLRLHVEAYDWVQVRRLLIFGHLKRDMAHELVHVGALVILTAKHSHKKRVLVVVNKPVLIRFTASKLLVPVADGKDEIYRVHV